MVTINFTLSGYHSHSRKKETNHYDYSMFNDSSSPAVAVVSFQLVGVVVVLLSAVVEHRCKIVIYNILLNIINTAINIGR